MRVIQERDDSNNPLVSYTRGNDLSGSMEGAGGIGGLLARSSGYSGGNWTSHAYYFADGNGTITYMLNGSQSMVASYRYDPFGNTISSSGTLASANVYRFSSKEIHANSGMYYYGFRFYDPNLQRWVNRDPEAEGGFLLSQFRSRPQVRMAMTSWSTGPLSQKAVLFRKDPREFNLYTCVGNDPLSNLDPYGLDWSWGDFCNAVAKGTTLGTGGGIITKLITRSAGWLGGLAGTVGGAFWGAGSYTWDEVRNGDLNPFRGIGAYTVADFQGLERTRPPDRTTILTWGARARMLNWEM